MLTEDRAPAARRAGGARRPRPRPPPRADHEGRPRAPDAQGRDVGASPTTSSTSRSCWRRTPRRTPASCASVGVGAGALLHGRQLGAQRHPARCSRLGGHAVHIPYPLLWEHEHVDHDEDLDELASIKELPAALRADGPRTYDRSRWTTTEYLAATAPRLAAPCSTPSAPPARTPPCRRARGGRPTDLAWHIGEVHEFWGTIVADRLTDPDAYVQPPRPADVRRGCSRSPSDWAGRARSTSLDRRPIRRRRCGRGRERPDVGFVAAPDGPGDGRPPRRRRAGGRARRYAIDAELAADGIDEFLFAFLALGRRRRRRRSAGSRAPALHRRRRRVAGASTTAPAATSSPASTPRATRRSAARPTTCCWCCGGACPLDAVEVIGDRAVAERFVARTDLSG